MDDHFWPLLYPALIVGALYGLTRGGYLNLGLGMLGALAGAVLSFLCLLRLGIENAAATFVALVISSWLGAFALISAMRVLLRR